MGAGFVGTGTLTVGGAVVAVMHNCTYSGAVEVYEQILGAKVGKVSSRRVVKADAILKADYIDVIANIGLFIPSAYTISGGDLTEYDAMFNSYQGELTIHFTKCNIIPSGEIKLAEAGWAGGSLEIKAVGSVLPQVWFGAESTTVFTVVDGTTYEVVNGTTLANYSRIVVNGHLTVGGTLSVAL